MYIYYHVSLYIALGLCSLSCVLINKIAVFNVNKNFNYYKMEIKLKTLRTISKTIWLVCIHFTEVERTRKQKVLFLPANIKDTKHDMFLNKTYHKKIKNCMFITVKNITALPKKELKRFILYVHLTYVKCIKASVVCVGYRVQHMLSFCFQGQVVSEGRSATGARPPGNIPLFPLELTYIPGARRAARGARVVGVTPLPAPLAPSIPTLRLLSQQCGNIIESMWRLTFYTTFRNKFTDSKAM